MLKTILGKIIGIFLLVVTFLGILFFGLNVFFNWKSYQYNNTKLKLLESSDEFQRAKDEEDRRKMTQQQREYYEKLNKGYQEKGRLLNWDEVEDDGKGGRKGGYLGIQGHAEAINTQSEGQEGVLIYTEEQTKHFNRILEDIDDFMNGDSLKLNVEGETGKQDQYRFSLLRNNCILYGAPGTGKTEFVRELNHVLIKRYWVEPTNGPNTNDPQDPANAWDNDEEEKTKLPEPIVPIFEIKGLDISSTGKDEPKVYEKLILCLKKLKNDFFKMPDEKGEIGEFSNLPYILFIEEADQAKNPFTYRPEAKNNLEELKNFFSTSEDSQGLRANSQDPNSICIIATNNYETIDPAMKRRGRLGKSLNFTFNPMTLRKYSEEIDWPQLNGEEHHDWKFQDNKDFHLLLKLAERFNFDNIKEKFVPKTQEILEIWNEWDEKEREDFSRNRLGIESQVWCKECQKETESEKPSQIVARIKSKLKDVEEQEERNRIREEELQKKLTCCRENEGDEHEAEVICNWLLHYISTFFRYHETQQLENYKHPDQTERFDFDKGRLLRERIQHLQRDIYETSVDLINTCGEELRRISSQTERMGNSSDETFREIAELKDILGNYRNPNKRLCAGEN